MTSMCFHDNQISHDSCLIQLHSAVHADTVLLMLIIRLYLPGGNQAAAQTAPCELQICAVQGGAHELQATRTPDVSEAYLGWT